MQFVAQQKPTSSRALPSHLPDQLVEILVVDVSVHVSEIAAHREDEVLGAVQLVLRLNEVDEFFDLFFRFCFCVCREGKKFPNRVFGGEKKEKKEKSSLRLAFGCSPPLRRAGKGLTDLSGPRKSCDGRRITHPSIDIVVGTVFIVNDGLVVAEDVEAEARRGPVIVEENASEKISVICGGGRDKFPFKVSVTVSCRVMSHPSWRSTSKSSRPSSPSGDLSYLDNPDAR